MPITRKEFYTATDDLEKSWMEKVRLFLVAHRDQAFSEDELKRELGLTSNTSPEEFALFSSALEKLLDRGEVEAGVVSGVFYYALAGPPAYKF